MGGRTQLPGVTKKGRVTFFMAIKNVTWGFGEVGEVSGEHPFPDSSAGVAGSSPGHLVWRQIVRGIAVLQPCSERNAAEGAVFRGLLLVRLPRDAGVS
jgi:hypothetical protein